MCRVLQHPPEFVEEVTFVWKEKAVIIIVCNQASKVESTHNSRLQTFLSSSQISGSMQYLYSLHSSFILILNMNILGIIVISDPQSKPDHQSLICYFSEVGFVMNAVYTYLNCIV